MTFEQIIERANQTGDFHVFGEYADGKRGYFKSFKDLAMARRFVGKICDGIIYDRTGESVG